MVAIDQTFVVATISDMTLGNMYRVRADMKEEEEFMGYAIFDSNGARTIKDKTLVQQLDRQWDEKFVRMFEDCRWFSDDDVIIIDDDDDTNQKKKQ